MMYLLSKLLNFKSSQSLRIIIMKEIYHSLIYIQVIVKHSLLTINFSIDNKIKFVIVKIFNSSERGKTHYSRLLSFYLVTRSARLP